MHPLGLLPSALPLLSPSPCRPPGPPATLPPAALAHRRSPSALDLSSQRTLCPSPTPSSNPPSPLCLCHLHLSTARSRGPPSSSSSHRPTAVAAAASRAATAGMGFLELEPYEAPEWAAPLALVRAPGGAAQHGAPASRVHGCWREACTVRADGQMCAAMKMLMSSNEGRGPRCGLWQCTHAAARCSCSGVQLPPCSRSTSQSL